MKNKTQNKYIIGSIAVLVLLVLIGRTLAFFWDEDRAVNEFTTSDTGIGIQLTEPNWNTMMQGYDSTPGRVLTKDPTVKNLEDDVYLRMIVEIIDRNEGLGWGEKITSKERADKIFSMVCFAADAPGQQTAADLAKLPRVNPVFARDESREIVGTYVFNYNQPLGENESTLLFNYVVVPKDWTAEDINLIGDFDIIIRGQAIQAEHVAFNDAFKEMDLVCPVISTP